MVKVRQIFGKTIPIGFKNSQSDFNIFWHAFSSSELGRIYQTIPWEELVKSSKIKEKQYGNRPLFSPQGKLALMFLKAYTGLSDRKLMEQINANYQYQFFCGIHISPTQPIINYKIISKIRTELAGKLELRKSQKVLASSWKPYMNNLNSMLEDATCFESEQRYPTRVKLLWESTEWIYGQMKRINKRIGGRMPRSKFAEQKDKYLNYSRMRRKSHKKTNRRIRSLLYLLEKLLGQLQDLEKELFKTSQMPPEYYRRVHTIKQILKQQKALFAGEKVKHRITHISKSYLRPIVRGKETKRVEFGAKANIVQVDKINFIEHIDFEAFNEVTRLESSVFFVQSLFGKKIRVLGADRIYASNSIRRFYSRNRIMTGFVRKGRASKYEPALKSARQSISKERATVMEGAFGTQKEHYSLGKIKAKTSKNELLWIFFGIHTANAAEIGKRLPSAKQKQQAA